LLKPSGIAADLLAEGIRITGVAVHVGGRLLSRLNMARLNRPDAFMLTLPQDRTEAILRDHLERGGGAVRFGREVAEVSQDDTGVRVRFADGAEESYDLVLGADGTRSRVRGSLGLPFDGHDLPEKWAVADVEAEGWPFPDTAAIFLNPKGRIALVMPIAPGRYRVFADGPEALAQVKLPFHVTCLREAQEFAIAVRQVSSYSIGRVHLAGDAAHCHSPVGGRGMNLGIADACDFAERVAQGTLDGYSAARHREGRHVIRLSEAARKLVAADDPFRRGLVRGFLWTAGRLPGVERLFLNQLLFA
jgi:2-polyprenyl-6-methoxyphenol hydroxylase-like FAD-dependent oxidoreductase